MARYEMSEGSSNKFWEITVKGNDVVTSYGRIGSAGQSTTKVFNSPGEAKVAADKLIAEKVKKGYKPAGTGSTSTTPPAVANNPLIERLDRWLKRDRPEFYAALKPGTPAEDIQKFEKEIGYKLPQTLKDLLTWRNDDDTKSSERFIDNWSLMSFQSIAKSWRGMKKLKNSGDFESEVWWDTGWIMFMENGGGDNLCIDLKGTVGSRNSVIEFWHEDPDRNIAYDSIDDLVEQFLNEVEKGHWEIDSGGFFNWGGSPGDDATPAAPVAPVDTKTTMRLVCILPENKPLWSLKPDVSPDGKHYVYTVEDPQGSYFILDGNKSPTFEYLNAPEFSATGMLVFREGKPGSWRWHIGEEIHDSFEQSNRPVFTQDGRRNCYSALFEKKWAMVVDGKPQKDSYDSIGSVAAWSPDGTKIAFKVTEKSKEFVINNGTPEGIYIYPAGMVYSPDGTRLAYQVNSKQPGNYQIVCGAEISPPFGRPVSVKFTPSGEIWYPYTAPDNRFSYGLRIGNRAIVTKRKVEEAFFHGDGKLGGHIETDDDSAYLVRPEKKDEKLLKFQSGLFLAPDHFAIVVEKVPPPELPAGTPMKKKMVLNGRESVEFDSIIRPQFNADGSKVCFAATRGSELLWVEMAI